MQSKEKITDDMQVKSGEICLCSIGRFAYAKNFDHIPAIAKKIKEKNINFKWFIIGYGGDEQLIHDKIKESGMEDEVIILGKKANPYPYIKAADAFICSSRSEGFSTVATEAMILQKPIFTTDCAGMKELFGEYNCGMICKNSEDGLKRMLEEVFAKENFDEYQQDIKKRSEFFKLERRMKEISDIID